MLKQYGAKFEVSPCHVTSEKKDQHVNLLLIQDFYINEYEENNRDDDGSLPKYHLKLTDLEELSFRRATICHICRKPIHGDELAVRDHCHLTGRFRGAAHNSCNLNYKNSRFVPVIFHNLNYDTHFILNKIVRGRKRS
ncbi:uncharacterized protein LOC116417451 [Nasonia vitripennis]|uniref:DNA-directed DNA polymerase n=1 Tax=Nasonia vitripennis TaxID=7425 RepID=A0A7M7QGT3_NASVI|nr:uncharacterized protein LOC116417451 [Nasonia vitripennis]